MPVLNTLKHTLASGGIALGTWVHFVRTPSIVRMIAAAGFDFVCIDMQHSGFSLETVGDMCDMARAAGLIPLVRVATLDGPSLNRIQDLGAMGLILPDIRDAAQIEDILPWLRYPPAGRRSATSSSAHTDYEAGPLPGLQRAVENSLLLIPQIESPEGLAQVDTIVATGAVDILDIGRGDLAFNLGASGNSRHAAVHDAVDVVVEAAMRHHIPIGTTYTTRDDAADMLSCGVRCLTFSSDRRILHTAYTDAVRELRSLS